MKFLCLIYSLCVNGILWVLKVLFLGWLEKVSVLVWFFGRLVSISLIGLIIVM